MVKRFSVYLARQLEKIETPEIVPCESATEGFPQLSQCIGDFQVSGLSLDLRPPARTLAKAYLVARHFLVYQYLVFTRVAWLSVPQI